jgi:hypothetical protein
MESFVVSNLLVVLLFASGVGIGVFVRRNRIWREAARELWRRRPWALLVVGLYIAIATLDSIAWVGGEQAGDDVVSASVGFSAPRSVATRRPWPRWICTMDSIWSTLARICWGRTSSDETSST